MGRRGLVEIVAAVLLFGAGAMAAHRYDRPDFHPHAPMRYQAIISKAALFPKGQDLLIGDSRSELLYLPRFHGRAVLNAGIGGTDIAYWTKHAPALVKATKPAEVIVALGVNDTERWRKTDPREWEAEYRALVRSLAGSHVVLVSIWPVEHGKPLGDQYFDPTLIARFNAVIAQVANSTGAELIPAPSTVAGLTMEGVHFTPAGNRLLASQFASR